MTTPTRRWRVRPATRPLRGGFSLPGDKSIGHRALILASLAEGSSRLRWLSRGADILATRAAFEAMGVVMRDEGDALRVEGVGLGGLRAAPGDIDCGNSGTTLRLLAGVLAAQGFASRLTGDDSLTRRPMGRVTRPLRARGARVEGRLDAARNDECAPLEVRGLEGGARLWELEYELPVASAQVKSALLLSGLFADGDTALREPTLSRDHTERMLLAMGAPLETLGPLVRLDPAGWSRVLAPLDLAVPGDPSSAAFLVAAAHVVPGSRIAARGVCVNPTRAGFLEVLRDQGGGAALDPKGEQGSEPVADLHVGLRGAGEVRGPARVAGELAVRCIDEVPALVAVAAVSPGVSEFRDLAELRVKESDRVRALVEMLRAFSIEAEERPDGLRVEGGRPRGATLRSGGDHRVAMAAAVLALGAEGESIIDDVGCVDTSFPDFAPLLRALGADIEEV
ncbi:MAG: 3-phosphoshikimate 1-carboxyvinyltransferase [Polyangiales bacterium]